MYKVNSLQVFFVVVGLVVSGCHHKGDVNVDQGTDDPLVPATEEGIKIKLTEAYSYLDGVNSQSDWQSATSFWMFGSIRGLEANRGSDADLPELASAQDYPANSDESWFENTWMVLYEAVDKCNLTLDLVRKGIKTGTITPQQGDTYVRQARTLRGWYLFEAWRIWGTIPYVPENSKQGPDTVSIHVRNAILEDLMQGISLPDNMGQNGFFNRTVSRILYAKALMQMEKAYGDALAQLQDVALHGTKPNGDSIGLAQKYGDIFDIENRNCIENIYTIQYSINDGSGGMVTSGNAMTGLRYNPEYLSTFGSFGLFKPTQEFVNSFRTQNGLPLLDFSYNENPVKNDVGLSSETPFSPDFGPLDPRLDWTVGRRGVPFWDWGRHPGSNWVMNQMRTGPYSLKKLVFKKSQQGEISENGSWTKGYVPNGYPLIRYAEVLLLIAECEIETGDLTGAREQINLIRSRAANPEGFVYLEDGKTKAANYQISLYPDFKDIEQARQALYMECKLEFGLEGHRFYDLVRWGIVLEELNRVLNYERNMVWGKTYYRKGKILKEDIECHPPKMDRSK
jgi:starch-binding outer membrane protein, SusD/RagB family